MVRVRNASDRAVLVVGVAKVRPGDAIDVDQTTADMLVADYGFEFDDDEADEEADDDTDDPPLEARTKSALYDLATEADIAGRSQMTKDELIDALRED